MISRVDLTTNNFVKCSYVNGKIVLLKYNSHYRSLCIAFCRKICYYITTKIKKAVENTRKEALRTDKTVMPNTNKIIIKQ